MTPWERHQLILRRASKIACDDAMKATDPHDIARLRAIADSFADELRKTFEVVT